MLYLGMTIFLAFISLIIPPLLVVTVPVWLVITALKAFTVLWSAFEK